MRGCLHSTPSHGTAHDDRFSDTVHADHPTPHATTCFARSHPSPPAKKEDMPPQCTNNRQQQQDGRTETPQYVELCSARQGRCNDRGVVSSQLTTWTRDATSSPNTGHGCVRKMRNTGVSTPYDVMTHACVPFAHPRAATQPHRTSNTQHLDQRAL